LAGLLYGLLYGLLHDICIAQLCTGAGIGGCRCFQCNAPCLAYLWAQCCLILTALQHARMRLPFTAGRGLERLHQTLFTASTLPAHTLQAGRPVWRARPACCDEAGVSRESYLRVCAHVFA